MNTQKGFAPIVWVIILAVLLGGGYAIWTGTQPILDKGWNLEKEVRENKMKDWKTYRNDKYGFEFKYPEKLKVLTKEGAVDTGVDLLYLHCDTCSEWTLSLLINNQMTIENAVKNVLVNYPNASLSDTSIAGYPSRVLTYRNTTRLLWKEIFFVKDGTVFNFKAVISDASDVDAVLSTVRFMK